MKKIIVFLFVFSVIAFSQTTQFTLASFFTNNLVLQQKSTVPIWGTGKPGTAITITPSWGKKVKGNVRQDSNWMMKIKTPKAGGPYTITIVNEESTMVLKNILLGEVWLCSGQSNMEMPLQGWPPNDTIADAANEIQRAKFPKIRMFTVKPTFSPMPLSTCTGSWSECTPEVAAKFSATAYFFGKKLYKDLNVPIGLIQATWGGTPVQAWTSGRFITQYKEYADFSEKLKQGEKEFDLYMSWLSSHKTIDVSLRNSEARYEGLDFEDSLYAKSDFNDSSWRMMNLPTGWEATEVGNFDGTVWFRKNIEIPKHWVNKELVLELGPIDDFDITFINGKRIGGMETGSPWNIKRIYSVPADITKDSILTLAIRVIDNTGGGGLWGRPEQLNLHPKDDSIKISLAGQWKYLPIAEYRNMKFFLFNTAGDFYNRPLCTYEISYHTPTLLYNGMIAPVVPYTIKGAIWYQGETNVWNPEQYRSLFPLMIKNWRSDWHNEFPFYFAQIAPYTYSSTEQSQRLREVQLQTLTVPKTGMAVTLDIGSAVTIHPSNKVDVGERLARWALVKDYQKKMPFSGPIYKSFKIANGAIILSFDHGDGLIVKPNNGNNYFQIAGEDSIFRTAVVNVKGTSLIVTSPDVKKPIAVRYAWDNVVEATLFNSASLPASSFRTDHWDK